MNKLVFITATLLFITFSAAGQSGNKISAKTHNDLIEIASEYVQQNPNDTKADSLLQNSLSIKSVYTKQLDEISGGIYSSTSDVSEQVRLEREANNSDPRANAYSKAFLNTFKANNDYFPTVSVMYKNVLTESRLKMKTIKSKKNNMKKRKQKKN